MSSLLMGFSLIPFRRFTRLRWFRSTGIICRGCCGNRIRASLAIGEESTLLSTDLPRAMFCEI